MQNCGSACGPKRALVGPRRRLPVSAAHRLDQVRHHGDGAWREAGVEQVELAPQGVRVTVLCPGPVPSEFQARAGFAPGLDSAILNVSSRDVAQQAYRGLMANKRAVLPGLGIKIVPLLLRLFPRWFILAVVGRLQLGRR